MFDKTISNIENIQSKMVEAATFVLPVYKNRIFFRALNSDKVFRKLPYSPQYKKKRLAAGKRVNAVDYRFTGELSDSIRVVKVDNDKVGLAFMGERSAKIVDGLTKQRGDFTAFTDEEAKLYTDRLSKLLFE